MPYRPDARGAGEVVAALAAAAREVPLPETLAAVDVDTWGELLFAGDGLADSTEPSQSLLLAFARLHAGLVEHFDSLPARARDWYLQQQLGIQRLPPVADRVVLVVDGDPKRLPATLPKGSVVKAGTGPRGDRLYETTEALTVLGATVVGAHGERRLRDEADAVVADAARRRSGEEAWKPAEPFAPFADPADPAAEHALYVEHEDLVVGGQAEVRLRFHDAGFGDPTLDDTVLRDFLEALVWEAKTAEGHAPALRVAARGGGDQIVVILDIPRTAPDAHVRARFPDEPRSGFSRALAFAFAFERLELQVESEFVPEAAFANEAILDVTKDFEPFGAAPRRNDAFYLKADEALRKDLESLEITLLGPNAGTSLVASPYSATATAGEIRWERLDESGAWDEIADSSFLRGATTTSPGALVPGEITVGGVPGRYIRGRLAGADFGWDRYEAQLNANAAAVATKAVTPTASVTVVTPNRPVTPVLSSVVVEYTTRYRGNLAEEDPVRVYRRNGLESPVDTTADVSQRPFRELEAEGTLTVGLDAVPAGELVTVYFELEEASGCDPPAPGATFAWEYLGAASTWKRLEFVDGTLGLRQTGVLRFAAPLDWAEGAPGVDERAGKWIRAVSSDPGVAGRIRAVRTDAVEARYRFPAGAEGEDVTPATPLAPGQAAKLRVAVPGIKKVENRLPSVGGRGPESDPRFFARAATVVRHRNRAVNPWDLEQLVVHGFPEVALCRCLPHHSRDSECAPGWSSLVVVPDSSDRTPAPTVLLAAEIEHYVRARGSPHLRVAVLCPLYVEVSVAATVHLRRGLPAGPAIREVERHLRAFLHPLGRAAEPDDADLAALAELERARLPQVRPDFGRPLYRSAVIAVLEGHPAVDHVSGLVFGGEHAALERVDVDSCRGLVASALVHALQAEAAL